MKQCFFLGLFICITLLVAPDFAQANGITFKKLSSLKKTSKGKIRILVQFKSQSVPNEHARSLYSSSDSQKDSYLLNALKRTPKGETLRGRFITPSLRSLSVTEDDLLSLLAEDELEVYEDTFHKPSLASSVSVIFPNQATSLFLGAGQVVAVLDTGVAKDHAFLASAVIANAEACFSTEDTNQSLESLCPGGVASMTGPGAADACDANILGCEHGTQMAGVIAGSAANGSGVAPSTNIIPVQVYSRSSDEAICGIGQAPCIGALTSDIIAGLNYVNSISSSYSIAAVNLSFGSTATYQGVCDANEPASYLAEIASLVSSDIVVIGASGNSAQTNEMNSPACLDDVTAVAATNDADTPWPANNRNSELEFFAPGVSVSTSGLPINTYASVTGTSIAAAHLSGAWAVMKSKEPSASLTKVKNAFTSTGTQLIQGLFSKPRINLTAALGELTAVVEPPVAPQESDLGFLPAVILLLDE